MVAPRPLARAPIMEAIIDLRVHVAEGVNVVQLDEALSRVNFGYVKKGPILRGQFGFSFNTDEAPIAQPLLSETMIVGGRFHSIDEKYVAQFTTEGFTLSRLSPYESWEALIDEARRVWDVYRICVGATLIHRTATRYINNLSLPMHPGDRFEKYLTSLPTMPPDFPQTISSFLQRFVVLDGPSGATAILTQALDQVTTVGPLPVILDIDVFRETKFPSDSQEVWTYLTDLRTLKNRFFFGALTDAAMELYA
jgi:uncharacterized protein (TIGR04255 family)